MSWADIEAQANADLFDHMAESVTFIRRDDTEIETRAVIDRDIELLGEFDTVVERRTEVGLLLTEVPAPRRGEQVRTATELFRLDTPISEDGHESRWSVVKL